MTTENSGAPDGRAPSGHDLASLNARFVALFFDWVACLVFIYTLSWLGMLSPDPFLQTLYPGALFIAYYTFCMAVGTQSLGMAVVRIACVSAATGDRLGFGRSLIRAVLLSLVLPALTALADPYHRGLHDRAAGSVMLKSASDQPR
ncbi:RDD family protein [Glycomyces sp. L485]|uniref:RDD family protein n=1 Tax=Glycomyces sp. L485 TaxID=2909235 RepID=UPI001F4B04ED|nr:RDD family protein [Glycomyces sp. L485]MCH7232413.1 RDD family protein [Glycomyces sp. L485]